MLHETELLLDALFIDIFAKQIFFKSWHWLQEYDDVTLTDGHRSRNMAKHEYGVLAKVQQHQLEWQNMSCYDQFQKECVEYKECVRKNSTTAPNQAAEEPFSVDLESRKVKYFFESFIVNLQKHMGKWLSEPLIICAVGGDYLSAKAFAKWLLDGSLPPQNVVFGEELHGMGIDLRGYVTEIDNRNTRELEYLKTFVTEHHIALEKVANSADVWSEEQEDVDILWFRTYIQTHIVPLMLSTHYIERGVQETGIAASVLQRTEGKRSAIVLTRSVINEGASRLIRQAQESGHLNVTRSTQKCVLGRTNCKVLSCFC